MYYYAHLNSSNLVDAVYAFETQTTEEGYIEITEAQYELPIIEYRYYPETGSFQRWYWSCDTDDIKYPGTITMITTILDDLQDGLDGKADADHSHSEYAATNHTHSDYAASDHTHSNYSLTTHTHTASEVGAAASDHTHSNYASSTHNHDSAYSAINHTHTNYATADHSHSNYSLTTHTHTASDIGAAASDHTHSGYANASHTHTTSDVTDLQTTLDGLQGSMIGKSGTESGGEIFNNYTGNVASGMNSHAEGNLTTASGNYAHAQGSNTTASNGSSHAEGSRSTSSGVASHSEGWNTVASGHYSHAEGYYTTALDYQHASGRYNAVTTPPSSNSVQDSTHSDGIFVVGYGTSSARANALRITSGGRCFGAMSFGAGGADFAELFEWADGNLNNEDRRGRFVTLVGKKIKLANAGDEYLGVISGAPAFVGNSASEEWKDKYMTDVFGARLTQEIDVPAVVDEITGEVITPATTATQYVVNPDYNPNEPYVMRENRKEWGVVGLLGQLVMVDDGTCIVGSYAAPSVNGIATASTSVGYRVLDRVDDTHALVLVR